MGRRHRGAKLLLCHWVLSLVCSVLWLGLEYCLNNKAEKIPVPMNARVRSLCAFLNGPSDDRSRIAVALGDLLSARPSRGVSLYWRFFHDPMGIWRWERVDRDGNVHECARGFVTYSECLADAVWVTFGKSASGEPA